MAGFFYLSSLPKSPFLHSHRLYTIVVLRAARRCSASTESPLTGQGVGGRSLAAISPPFISWKHPSRLIKKKLSRIHRVTLMGVHKSILQASMMSIKILSVGCISRASSSKNSSLNTWNGRNPRPHSSTPHGPACRMMHSSSKSTSWNFIEHEVPSESCLNSVGTLRIEFSSSYSDFLVNVNVNFLRIND